MIHIKFYKVEREKGEFTVVWKSISTFKYLSFVHI